MLRRLDQLRALIIDMDGVLWHGDTPVPGLMEFFDTLRNRDIRFVIATNNASKTAAQYVEKLAGMGVEVSKEEILTSAMATAYYLRNLAQPGSTVFVIGEDGLLEPLQEAGFTITRERSDYVVCGMDRAINWEKLAQATLNIRAGAMFIGTNPDTTLPTERGIVHGNGAILAALATASEVKPIIIGKPEPIMYQQAMIRLGVNSDVTAALGDRLETDILGAKRAGIASVMVMTGISTRAELEASDYKPEWVFDTLRDFTAALKNI